MDYFQTVAFFFNFSFTFWVIWFSFSETRHPVQQNKAAVVSGSNLTEEKVYFCMEHLKSISSPADESPSPLLTFEWL